MLISLHQNKIETAIYIYTYGGVYLVLCLEADTAETFVPEDVAPGEAIRARPIKAQPTRA